MRSYSAGFLPEVLNHAEKAVSSVSLGRSLSASATGSSRNDCHMSLFRLCSAAHRFRSLAGDSALTPVRVASTALAVASFFIVLLTKPSEISHFDAMASWYTWETWLRLFSSSSR